MIKFKICQHCKRDFVPSPGFKTLCSKVCHDAVSYSKEVKKKQSLGQHNYYMSLSKDEKQAYIRLRNGNKKGSAIRKTWKDKMNKIPWDELSLSLKRKRVLEEQQNACLNCGNTHWRGENLPLELDHIDGNTSNNARSNLRMLCPNCHSITSTWRGRNCPTKRNVKDVSDLEIMNALKVNPSIRTALLSIGLSAKGNNVKRANELTEILLKESGSNKF